MFVINLTTMGEGDLTDILRSCPFNTCNISEWIFGQIFCSILNFSNCDYLTDLNTMYFLKNVLFPLKLWYCLTLTPLIIDDRH